MTWLESAAFSSSRLFRVEAGLKLPLQRIGFLDGDGGFGRTATYFLPLEQGVWVSRRGVVALYSHDLTRELWRKETEGWLGRPTKWNDSIIDGPDDHGRFFEFDAGTGRVLRSETTSDGLLASVTQSTVLFSCSVALGSRLFRCRDRGTLAVLWERPGTGRATACEEKYLIDDCLGSILFCVDGRTGRVEWTFELGSEAERNDFLAGRKRLKTIKAGFPSVVSVGERIVVVLEDSTVLTLDARTGKVTGRAQPPFPGIHLVTEKSVFFLQAFGLSEFDHGRLKEVDRIEYRAEAEPVYGKAIPYPCAFWLTHESVIWTDLNGLLVGVSRQAGRGGKRDVWHDRPEKAAMPIADFPLAYGDYLYRAEKGDRLGLYCYRSAHAWDRGAAGGSSSTRVAGAARTPPTAKRARRGQPGRRPARASRPLSSAAGDGMAHDPASTGDAARPNTARRRQRG